MLVLIEVYGKSSIDQKDWKKNLEGKKNCSCKGAVAPYIIDPKNKYKVMWDLFIGIIYLLSYLVDPVVFAF